MTFDAVVFGSYVVGTGYTDGDAITGGGLQLFIKPTKNIGSNPLDVTITYVDQFGNAAEVTTVSTSVPALTTAGSHIQVVLNTGDSGVQDVINVTVTGGTPGDEFNVESWNEGIGKSPFTLSKSATGVVWANTEPTKEITHHEHSWIKSEQMDVTLVNTIKSGSDADQSFVNATEIYQPNYVTEFKRFGFMEPFTTDIQDNTLKQLKSYLGAGTELTVIDTNEPATRYKWLWAGTDYEDSGFYQIDFDFALNRGSLFTFELLDKENVIKLSRASNTKGWTGSPTIHSYCGQETSYPASNTRDGNTTTEWRHYVDEKHWIIYDLGAGAVVGGVKIFWKGLSSGYLIDISSSDDLTNWTEEVSDLDLSGAPEVWKVQEFVPVQKRYIKIEIDPYKSDDGLDDYMETQFYLLEHQSLVFKSLAFEMRLRCSTSGTTAGTEYLDIRNIKIYRYKKEGTVTSNFPVSVTNIHQYDELLRSTNLPAGTNVKLQLAFSDNGTTWSSYTGPDGTINTFYDYTGQPIGVPIGYTGYWYKWKAYLYSDGRETPTLDQITVWMWIKIQARWVILEIANSGILTPANPQITSPIPLNKAIPRACNGYPEPPAGGDFEPDTLSGNILNALQKYSIWIIGVDETWIPDCLSGRSFKLREFLIVRTFSEATVGQVLSGYVRDQNENILPGIKVIITSTYSIGLDQMGTVNPATGFYQIFVKNTKYDDRSLVVAIEGKSYGITYIKHGLPDVIDGTKQVISPMDLHFKKPSQICSKSVAYVGSLVTY